jgi:hypothetical protein
MTETETHQNDGAFPLPEGPHNLGQNGLTKREYFAAMAMQGYLASERREMTHIHAANAVNMADVLIEELNK